MKTLISILLIGFMVSSVTNLSFGKSAIGNDSKEKTKQTQNKPQEKAATAAKESYTCPMHAEVVSDKPGKCPKCKMTLVKQESAKDVYTCPMHSDVVSDKPGKCPKCKMKLEKKVPVKKAESKKL